ncbi:hypothetical protein PV327_011432, partial [Microctonus hyperodae]
EISEEKINATDNKEHYPVRTLSKNRNLTKNRKVIKPNLQVARTSKSKRKLMSNNSESDEEEASIIAALLKQIDELKNEIQQLKKNNKETNKNEQKFDDDEMEIIDIQTPSTSQQKEDDNDWITVIKNKNNKSNKNEKYSMNNEITEENKNKYTGKTASIENNKYRETRPPPINIFEQQIKDTIQVLRKGTKTNDFQIKRMSDHLHVVKMNDYNDYKKTIEILKDTNTHDKTEAANIYCTLCHEYGHPATYRGCPKQIQAMENKTLNKNTTQKTTINTINEEQNKQIKNNKVVPNKTYADKLKGNTNSEVAKEEKNTISDKLSFVHKTEIRFERMQEHLNYMTDLYLMNQEKMDKILDIIE